MDDILVATIDLQPHTLQKALEPLHHNSILVTVRNSILVTDYLTQMGIKTSRSPSSLQPGPCSLRLLAIPKAQGKPQRQSIFHNRGHERGCDEGPKQAHTRRLPGGFPEVVETVQQVH